MEKDKRCCYCQQEIDARQTEELTEACRVYRIIQDITNAGCDAEIKKIKGKLKILSVKKSMASEIITVN